MDMNFGQDGFGVGVGVGEGVGLGVGVGEGVGEGTGVGLAQLRTAASKAATNRRLTTTNVLFITCLPTLILTRLLITEL